MRTSFWVVAVSTLALLGCATQRVEMVKVGPFTVDVPPDDGFDVGVSRILNLPDPALVRVWVNNNNQLVLDQEPIRTSVDQANRFARIFWFLPKPASGQGYSFPQCQSGSPCQAITFSTSTGSQPPPNLDCATPAVARRGLYCYYTTSDFSSKSWKYSLTVLDPSGRPTPTTPDPWISQN